MKYIVLSILAIGLLGCSQLQDAEQKTETPTNIIFLIGDGMGLSAVSTGIYYGDGPSQFYRFKNIGLQRTSSATHKVTDSAASGTALASGTKTYNGAIGVDTTHTPHQNIVEFVSTLGWSTGVAATSTISHATPASFYAHVEQRKMEEAICAQLLDSEIDFFAGGGSSHFTDREDGINLLDLAPEKGFIVDTAMVLPSETLDPTKKYGFLPEKKAMPSILNGRGNFLPAATSAAIGHLSGNSKGFFLMVEGSQIDWAGHANNVDFLITEQLDFEEAVKVALDFAEKDGNTLVVVSADHETGGYALSANKTEEGKNDYKEIGPRFATSTHSATLIPVFAYGPGAEQFAGIYENTDIFEKMKALAN